MTLSFFRQAVNEKADRVAKCTEQVCSSLVEETLNADITLLVEHILEAELQRIHKYIKRLEREKMWKARKIFRSSCDIKHSGRAQFKDPFTIYYLFHLYHQVAWCGSSTAAAEETDERFPCSSLLCGPSIQTEGSGSQCPCTALHSRSGPWSGQPGKLWHPGPLQHQVCVSLEYMWGLI